MFAELGSSPQQWSDLKAAEVVAHAAVKTVSTFGESPVKTALGVGGQHYNDKFTRMALENEIAFGHMIPKYALPYVDMEILRQCVANTLERVESTVLDWKGIKGEHKPKLIQMLTEVGLAIQRI
jgi:D-aminoacyl-tRNA deacylase